MKTILVPTDRIQGFKKEIEKINKKAVKYGCEPFSYKVGDIETETNVLPVYEGGEIVDKDIFSREVYLVEINEPTIKVGEYKILAFISHDAGIKQVHAKEDMDTSMFDAIESTRCDHCHTKRVRKIQFVCQNTETNQILVVGKTCVKDYFGINAPEIFGWFINKDQAFDSLYESCKGGWVKTASLDTILALAIDEINQHGFKPSSEEFSTSMRIHAQYVAMTGRNL
jgi:hypothetical protein